MILVDEHPFGAGRVVRKYRLASNGLTAILLADASAPIVAYQTWLRVGSADEHEGKTGLAHLFEHLMFNQTERLAPGEFDRRLEAVGADSNAATWVDWTYYRENAPREHLGLVVELEAERLGHLVVSDQQVATERDVVMNERRLRVDDDVDGFLGEELFRLAFAHHPYRWPTIGWMEDIRALTTDDARAFYRAYYAPNNATVVVVGDFDEPAVLDLLARHYEPLAPSEAPPRAVITEPPQTGERRARFRKPALADRLLVGWRAPGLAEPDHAAVDVAAEILGGGHSSRLHRALVVDAEVASAVSLSVTEFRDHGLVELSFAMQRGHRAAGAETIVAREVERVAAGALGEEELAKARNRLEARHWRGLRPQEGKAEALGHWETTAGDYRALFAVAERVRRVTVDDVVRVCRERLREDLRTVVVAEPSSRRAS